MAKKYQYWHGKTALFKTALLRNLAENAHKNIPF